MRRICFSVSLLLISAIVRPGAAIAQGIGEMGGAYAASSGQVHPLMNSGVTGAVGGGVNGAVKSINSSTTGAASAGAAPSSSGANKRVKVEKEKGPRDGDEGPTPQQTAKKAGDLSNKLYSDGQAKLKANDLDGADKCFRQSLYYRESIWGAKDPAVPKIYELLGDIARKRANPVEAETCYHKSLTMLIKAYGPGDFVMATLTDKLGDLYMSTFKFADAVNVYQQSYTLNQRKFGDVSPQTVVSVVNLSKAYLGDESYRQASKLLGDYAIRLDKGPESNMEQLSSILELYQTALQKTNQPDMLQKVQARSQEVKDMIESKKPPKTADDSTAPGAGSAAAPANAPASSDAAKKSDTASGGAAPATAPAAPAASAPATPAAPATAPSKSDAKPDAKPAAKSDSKPASKPDAKSDAKPATKSSTSTAKSAKSDSKKK